MEAADDGPADRSSASLANSARGWHGVQLAVLAFIGLCGVLSDADPALPRWLQITAGVLAVAALIVSCLSIFVVASVAWPFSARVADNDGSQGAARRLRTGIALTYVAVGLMALAASSSWWPTRDRRRPRRHRGHGAHHRPIGAHGVRHDPRRPGATIRLATADGQVELAVSGLADISPVASC